MARKKGLLVIEIEYDDQKTDLESLSDGLDQVMDTARDLIGDAFFPEKDWGDIRVKSFRPLKEE